MGTYEEAIKAYEAGIAVSKHNWSFWYIKISNMVFRTEKNAEGKPVDYELWDYDVFEDQNTFLNDWIFYDKTNDIMSNDFIIFENKVEVKEMDNSTLRGDILDKAKSLTNDVRNEIYGDPHDNLSCFAELVTAYLRGTSMPLDASDGAIIMCLAKISRIAVGKSHADNYFDLAAYAAIAGECAGIAINHDAES
jgi:Domain of unknown function (DUF6378)